MGLASTIHDLKTLILSLHPVVVIETAEEERVGNLLDLIAEELELKCFDWTVTRGLARRVPDGGRRWRTLAADVWLLPDLVAGEEGKRFRSGDRQ